MATATRKGNRATLDRKGFWTFVDFYDIIQPDQKADLIDGVIYMASPEGIKATRLYGWLFALLFDFVQLTDLGEIFGSRTAFRLGPKDGPEPDIAFVKKARLHLARKAHIAGHPDVAMEIVSPESVERDYYKKRALYERAGVPEYSIIDEDLRRVTLLRLDRNGKYREIRPVKGILRSQVIKGFWLRPEWLWTETRPSKAEALKQILG
jgi:Uma2 family endonuclease